MDTALFFYRFHVICVIPKSFLLIQAFIRKLGSQILVIVVAVVVVVVIYMWDNCYVYISQTFKGIKAYNLNKK